jgi:hypothetical protein
MKGSERLCQIFVNWRYVICAETRWRYVDFDFAWRIAYVLSFCILLLQCVFSGQVEIAVGKPTLTRPRDYEPGIDSRQKQKFLFSPSYPHRLWGPPYEYLQYIGYWGKSDWGVKLSTQPHVVPRIRMHGVKPPLFTKCLVKYGDNFTFCNTRMQFRAEFNI